MLRSVRLIKAQAEAQLSNSWRPQKGWDEPDVLFLGTHWAELAEQRTCHGQGREREAEFSLSTRGLHTLAG